MKTITITEKDFKDAVLTANQIILAEIDEDGSINDLNDRLLKTINELQNITFAGMLADILFNNKEDK